MLIFAFRVSAEEARDQVGLARSMPTEHPMGG